MLKTSIKRSWDSPVRSMSMVSKPFVGFGYMDTSCKIRGRNDTVVSEKQGSGSIRVTIICPFTRKLVDSSSENMISFFMVIMIVS